MSLKLYAVRRKGTMLFLPETHKGYSWNEPTDWTVLQPRLHLSKTAANKALRAWARGTWSRETHHSFDILSGSDESSKITVHPVPSRDIQEMEVVPLCLIQGAF